MEDYQQRNFHGCPNQTESNMKRMIKWMTIFSIVNFRKTDYIFATWINDGREMNKEDFLVWNCGIPLSCRRRCRRTSWKYIFRKRTM